MSISNQIIIRQSVIDTCRNFFRNRGFAEVTLPILSTSIPDEPNIYPFVTIWDQSNDKKEKLFLSTSPEGNIKKLISQGLGNCFTISPSFRNLEAIGPHHNPEFLMLEWYQMNHTYLDIMATTKELLRQFNMSNFQSLSLTKYFDHFPDNEPDFNQQFLNLIEPQLPTDPTFITDYPAYLSPLADKQMFADINFSARSEPHQKLKNGEVTIFPRAIMSAKRQRVSTEKFVTSQEVSERFELYINRVEIANGCTENPNPPISVPWGPLPPCAGCGLGIDRLAMIVANAKSIHY